MPSTRTTSATRARVIFLNYSAVDPVLTNERCSFWHFRFDAHADMRVAALMDVVKDDAVAQARLPDRAGLQLRPGRAARVEAATRRRSGPMCRIVGDELHPMGRVKDFAPYATKIIASGAQAVITGNWGNDLTLLVKAAREAGFNGSFYTFYGNALGAPAAIGDAGIGRVIAVADWLPNVRRPCSRGLLPGIPRALPEAGRRLRAHAHAVAGRVAGAGDRARGQHRGRRRGGRA
jgi:branched-chain amino acid transport system substrate-binding protein